MNDKKTNFEETISNSDFAALSLNLDDDDIINVHKELIESRKDEYNQQHNKKNLAKTTTKNFNIKEELNVAEPIFDWLLNEEIVEDGNFESKDNSTIKSKIQKPDFLVPDTKLTYQNSNKHWTSRYKNRNEGQLKKILLKDLQENINTAKNSEEILTDNNGNKTDKFRDKINTATTIEELFDGDSLDIKIKNAGGVDQYLKNNSWDFFEKQKIIDKGNFIRNKKIKRYVNLKMEHMISDLIYFNSNIIASSMFNGEGECIFTICIARRSAEFYVDEITHSLGLDNVEIVEHKQNVVPLSAEWIEKVCNDMEYLVAQIFKKEKDYIWIKLYPEYPEESLTLLCIDGIAANSFCRELTNNGPKFDEFLNTLIHEEFLVDSFEKKEKIISMGQG